MEDSDFSQFGTHFLGDMLDLQITEGEPLQEENYAAPMVQTSIQDLMTVLPTTESDSTYQKYLNPFNGSNLTAKANQSQVANNVLQYKTLDMRHLIKKKLYIPMVKKVYTALEDPPTPSHQMSPAETNYSDNAFSEAIDVKYQKIHCTMCHVHIGLTTSARFFSHIELKVLVCAKCYNFYGDGKFPKDMSDGSEIYCRWCGQGGQLLCCSFCPRVFCKKCINSNIGPAYCKKVEAATDWACISCVTKPIWPLRAICRSVSNYIFNMRESGITVDDLSICCSDAPFNCYTTVPMVLATTASPATTSTKSVASMSTVSSASAVVTSTSPTPSTSATSTSSASSTPKISVRKNEDLFAKTTNVVTPTSVLVRPFTTQPILRPIIPLPKPPPLSLGRRFIPPPVTIARPILATATSNVSKVRPQPLVRFAATPVILPQLKPDYGQMRMSDIVTVRIPPNPDGQVLRLKLPDKTEFLIRLQSDKNMKSSNPQGMLVMPNFKPSLNKVDFFETAIKDAFKLEELVFERLMILKNLYETRTAINVKEIMNTVTKKMHFILGKAGDLLRSIDEMLLREFDSWKINRKKEKICIDVIDLSDEEDSNAFKTSGLEGNSIFSNYFKDPFREMEEKSEPDSSSYQSESIPDLDSLRSQYQINPCFVNMAKDNLYYVLINESKDKRKPGPKRKREFISSFNLPPEKKAKSAEESEVV